MNDLLNQKRTALVDGVYTATLKGAKVTVPNQQITLYWSINGKIMEQKYSVKTEDSKKVLDGHMDRFALQLGLVDYSIAGDLINQQFAIYLSTRIGDTGAPFTNIVPASQPKPEAEAEEETF